MIVKRFLAVTLSIILVFGLFSASLWAAPADIVNIPDPYFKADINSELGQPTDSDITEAQMALLQNLTASNASISDLSGIEYAVNLTTFIMRDNQVTNLEPLKSLPKIEYLSLSSNSVTSNNFPDLSQNTTLKSLSFFGTSVDNTVLDKVVQIQSLTLLRFESNYNITTIEPMTQLPNLQELWVQFCGVADFTPINRMSPTLVELYAFGQNTGRIDPITEVERTIFTYDEVTETLFIPFSMMPNVKTNFDGTTSPFTTSTSPSNTYLAFNDVQVAQGRLAIDTTGITVTGVTSDEYYNIDQMEYNARYDLPTGSYATPPNFTSYVISAGTYMHIFNIVDRPVITAKTPIYYWQGYPVDEATFLTDAEASTNDGSPITTDFTSQVDFSTPGSYMVTLNAQDADGTDAVPVQVEVIIWARPTVIAKDEITYYQYSQISEAMFLVDVEATTEPNNQMTNDFATAVNFNVIGDYQVAIIATNDQEISSVTKLVVVHIIPRTSTQSYVLSFDLNGGDGVAPVVQTLEFGALATEPAIPQKQGHVFKEWNTLQDGSGRAWDFASTAMPDNNVTLYAQWQKVASTEYTLSFNLNGGQGIAPINQILKVGEKTQEPNRPVREGYIFQGWNTATDGRGITWNFDSSTMPAENVTLYAQWKSQSLTKTGESNNLMFLSGVVALGSVMLMVTLLRKRQYLN